MRGVVCLFVLPACSFLGDEQRVWRAARVAAEDCAASPWWPDADGDGYGDGSAAPTLACRAPGAAWVGNAQDCADGDPAVGAPVAWTRDGDGDGFGHGAAILACVAPPGRVAVAGDCADADPARNPAAIERCGGGDEDCDGLTDDADPSLDGASTRDWFVDADGDGYGAGSPAQACVGPAGSVPRDGDCADDDAAVRPGVLEVCEDGLDNDCDGSAGFCRDTGRRVAPGPAPVGSPAGGVRALVAGPDGALWLGGGGAAPGLWQRDAGGALAEVAALAGVPVDVLVRGDVVDGDGRVGVSAGAPMAGPNGEAWLIWGEPTVDAPLVVAGSVAGAEAGAAVLLAALDAAGGVDWAIGQPGVGGVRLVRGPLGPGAVPEGYLSVTGAAGAFGAALASADLDSDGVVDVAVGAPDADTGAGAVYWFAGPADAPRDAVDADGLLRGAAGEAAGAVLAACGDADGDGADDLLLATAGPGGAAVLRWSGAEAETAALDGRWLLGPPAARAPLACAGDVDGDAAPDFGAAAPLDAADAAPAVQLRYGPWTAGVVEADLVWTGAGPDFAWALAGSPAPVPGLWVGGAQDGGGALWWLAGGGL